MNEPPKKKPAKPPADATIDRAEGTAHQNRVVDAVRTHNATSAKPETPRASMDAPSLAALPPGIPVRVLRLDRNVQLPGIPVTDVITATAKPGPGRREWRIEYIPQIRHHRITYFPHDARNEPEVVFVPESHVTSWTPG